MCARHPLTGSEEAIPRIADRSCRSARSQVAKRLADIWPVLGTSGGASAEFDSIRTESVS